MLEKVVQAAIYEKALKNHYIEILYIDFEDTGKCIKLHQDTKLLNGENIFPESDEQMFDDYICEKIMRYGTDAVERMNEVEDDRYDLIFMDIQMPKMDGYMTTREIRTLKNNRKANIPIVAMTANAFEEDKKMAFKAGMNAHIAKPIDIKTILSVFDQVFGTS